MANSSTGRDIAFVRTEDAPTLPPPASQVGVIGWLWRNVFSSMSNYSTPGAAVQSIAMILLTVVVGYLSVTQILAFLQFAFFDAVWSAPEGLTGKACRTTGSDEGGIQEPGWSGACYPFISAKWKLIVYGSYPAEELWRVDVVYLLGALGVGWLIAHVIPRRRIVGGILAVAGAILGLAIMTIYDEPLLGRVGVQILLGVGAMWMLMPAEPSRRVVGVLMLAIYPIVSFLLLTGGDLAVTPSSLFSLVAISGVLVVLSVFGGRGALGELGRLVSGIAGVFGKLGLAAAIVVFLASDIFVDMIEAASGNVVTEREELALDWWSARVAADNEAREGEIAVEIAALQSALETAETPGARADASSDIESLEDELERLGRTQRVPNVRDIAAFEADAGVSLTEAELERLRGMGWAESAFGAASGPGARSVWPLPPVFTDDWGGLLVTLVVSFVGIVASYPLGVLLAIGRRSTLPAVRFLCVGFIEFWRGVPLIYILFMSSVMLPFFLPEGTDFNKLARALVAVMIFNAAYQAEVVRGGLQALPKGQYEGAMALGLPYWRMMRLIILPQALTLVIPGTVNTMISLFKDTSLVLIISLFDLLNIVHFTALSDTEWASPVQASTSYLVVAFIFFLFCFSMSRYSMAVERELRRGRNR